ncbi:MAG: single-stranded DNA-binding protein [Nocardioidaceae bacterium]
MPSPPEHVNQVILRGKVSALASERTLPSGDTVVSARLVVKRPPDPKRRSAITVDTFDCVAWTKRAQQALLGWQPDQVVEVTGRLRRRFRRLPTGPISRVEVEVMQSRRTPR